MDALELPVDVLVTALASRLADLQSARTDTDSAQITPPQPHEGADRRALVAGQLMSVLEYRLLQGSNEYVAVDALTQAMQERIENVTADEVRFCARFLDVDRSIQFRAQENQAIPKETRAWTRLVLYQARLDRLKLSEAGRLFLKVLRHRRDWLYEDKHVEMLSRALRSGLFDDVPRLCQEILSSLRLFSEQLTAIRESPSIREMAQQYEQRREHFTDMLKRVLDASLEAREIFKAEPTLNDLDRFLCEHPDVTFNVSSLRRDLGLVHQAAESLNRNWASLLMELQRSRRERLGVLRFDDMLAEFVRNPLPVESMEALLAGVCGWNTRSRMASVAEFIGSVEPWTPPPDTTKVVYDDNPNISSDRTFSSWLKANSRAIVRALKKGPIRLSELILSGHVDSNPIHSMEDVIGAIGMYVVVDPLDGQIKVDVTCGPTLQHYQAHGFHILASDLKIQIRANPNGEKDGI